MAHQHPELERLLEIEREARTRCQLTWGFSVEVQAAALSLSKEASDAVRAYQADNPVMKQ
jgi:hypothetical protein